jgi:hypothetical protein
VGGLLAGSLAGMAAEAHHLTDQLFLQSTEEGAGPGSAAAGALAEDAAGAGLAALHHLPEMHMVVEGITLAAAGALLPGTTIKAPPLAEAPVAIAAAVAAQSHLPEVDHLADMGHHRRATSHEEVVSGVAGVVHRSGVTGQAEAGHTPQALATIHQTSTGVVVVVLLTALQMMAGTGPALGATWLTGRTAVQAATGRPAPAEEHPTGNGVMSSALLIVCRMM